VGDLLHMATTHALRQLSRTNACNVVPLCECGWVGSVHPTYREQKPDGKRGARVYEYAEDAARTEHRKHARG
jgi:hypothetical protein